MNVRKFGLLIISVILIGILSGCTSGCPDCPTPSTYSECNDQAIKTRTNYKCTEATNFECEAFTQEIQCETEITLSGNIDAIVTPSIEEKVKGVIKIEAKTVPTDAKLVAYFIDGGNLPPIESSQRLRSATKKGDVWTGMLDTTEYENGLYDIMIVGMKTETMEGDPAYYARGQILISN